MTKNKIVFYNGHIMTMVNETPEYVESVYVVEDRIEAVGKKDDLMKRVDPSATLFDLKGHTLLPGFIDPHGHFLLNALEVNNLIDCGVAARIETIQGLIKNLVEHAPKGNGPIVGFGFDDTRVDTYSMPTREELDQVSTTRPVLLLHASGHIGSANTVAFKKAKMWDQYKVPEGGVVYKDKAGHPTGVVEETPALVPLLLKFGLRRMLHKPFRAIEKNSNFYAKKGITTANEGASSNGFVVLLQIARRLSKLKTRVVSCPTVNHNNLHKLLKKKHGKAITKDKLLIEGPAKMFLDGSIQNYTAYLTQPYYQMHPTEPKEADYVGYISAQMDDFKSLFTKLHQSGRQIAVHCNGDGAIDTYIQTLREAIIEKNHDLRHLIIHCQMVRRDQLVAMKEIGAVPAFFPAHIEVWGDGHYDRFLGPKRAERISPLKTASDLGLIYTSHNDAPVTQPDPLRLIWNTVTRKTKKGRVLGEDERVTVYEGLLSVTRNCAIQYHLEEIIGTIEVGKLADFVILEKDPMTVLEDEIKDINVLSTWLNGRCIFNSDS